MKLYHASKCIVDHPDVSHSRDMLDFGKGFYLTSLEEQARKYALRFLQRGEKAYMNHYVLDEDLCDCRVKIFDSYDEEWLDFVSLCRIGKQTDHYDVVSGGIADMHCRSDGYLAGLLVEENAQTSDSKTPNN